MAGKSDIEWTEATWNPITGCSKISPGCKHCYAHRLAMRLKAIGQPNYRNGFKVTLHPQTLEIPLEWKKARTIFVNSMSDLFHRDVPVSFILKVFFTMRDSALASLPGTHEATRAREETRSKAPMDAKHLDGGQC